METHGELNVLGNNSGEDNQRGEANEFSSFLLLKGPEIEDISLGATLEGDYDAISGQKVNFRAICGTTVSRRYFNKYGNLMADVYWFFNGKIVRRHNKIRMPSNEDKVQHVESTWNATLQHASGNTIRVVFSTGIETKWVQETLESILPEDINVALTLQTNSNPSCLPREFAPYHRLPTVFVNRVVTFKASVFSIVSTVNFQWYFSDGTYYSFFPNAPISIVEHKFKKSGLHTVKVTVTTSSNRRSESIISLIAVHEITFNYQQHLHQFTPINHPLTVEVWATIANRKNWTSSLTCTDVRHTSILAMPKSESKWCFMSKSSLNWKFNQPGVFNCLLYVTDGRLILGTRQFSFRAYPELTKAVIKVEPRIATRTPVTVEVQFHPHYGNLDVAIEWKIINQNKTLSFKPNYTNTTVFHYSFNDPGAYLVRVIVSNPFSKVTTEANVTALDGIEEIIVTPFRPINYVKINSTLHFQTKYRKGTDIKCLWAFTCRYHYFYQQNLTHIIPDCDSEHRLVLPGNCKVSLFAHNEVSSKNFPDAWNIFIEEDIKTVQASVPETARLGSLVRIEVYLPNNFLKVMVDVDAPVQTTAHWIPYSSHYECNFRVRHIGLHPIRIRVYNNVSSAISHHFMNVVPELGPISIISIGCLLVGFPAKFEVLIKGVMRDENSALLYEWHFQDVLNTSVAYTTFPFGESHILAKEGPLNVTVMIRNDVSQRRATSVVEILQIASSPCLHHKSIAEIRKPVEFDLLGISNSPCTDGAVLKLLIRTSRTTLVIIPRRIPTTLPASSSRWRYVFYSSAGFRNIIGQVFLSNSECLSNLTFRLGIQIQKPLESVDIKGSKHLLISRIPLNQEWQANVNPTSAGNIFTWSFQHVEKTLPEQSKFIVHDKFLPGSYELKLTVWNSLGHVNASMFIQTAVTLLALNYTFSDLFVDRESTLSVLINQADPPDIIFVDFGDGKYDSRHNAAAFFYQKLGPHLSYFMVTHMYHFPGLHTVYFKASNSVSDFEHWVIVDVEVPISGVSVELLSSSVVALFEDVVVMCTVEKGTNLDFEWDFGDGTDGQYTMVNSSKDTSIATHSYGVADTYTVLIHVFNNHETVTTYLNVTIQAVEPIEKLYLQPRMDLYAAPLFERKASTPDSNSSFSTDVIVFETWVWRGSDIHFFFDFGDGHTKLVASELNVWSLPYANVKHTYAAEGVYNVTVTATNPLDSVNQSLLQPFYVQFPPEGLKLDRQYYIIEYLNNLTLHSSISRGTNVSFNWILDSVLLNDTSSTIILSWLKPGVYIISVEACNEVTDFAYKTVIRPKISSKIYVQERLQGVKLCVENESGSICHKKSIEIPFEEKTKFFARVIPPTEKALRYTWNVGTPELKRTNVPLLQHQYHHAGWYTINVTAQNHISSVSSQHLQLHLVQKVANLTSILCQGPNLVNYLITFHALYWFGTNLTFQWDFGDGSPLITTQSSFVQHSYKNVGEYWITASAWNAFSHANITTNMFFLHELCQKPEISFLHEKHRIANFDDDILIETEIITNCVKNSIRYTWSIESADNSSLATFQNSDILCQRKLLIPKFSLAPGKYFIHLKVSMAEFIVYAKASTSLEVQFAKPVLTIEGGYLRRMGRNDTIEVHASLLDNQIAHSEQNLSLRSFNSSVSYFWSCLPVYQKHLSCFNRNAPHAFISNETNKFVIPASLINPNLNTIAVNVTVQNVQPTSTTQVIEIHPVSHTLLLDIYCDGCRNHQVNKEDRIKLKAVCKNCASENIKYKWKIWIIDDGRHQMHFSNYKCVQADASTFFIVAPNTTLYQSTINTTNIHNESLNDGMQNSFGNGSLNQLTIEDLPPFPNLPGFPEEPGSLQEIRNVRVIRDNPDYNLPEENFLDLPQYLQYPYEGDAEYDDNSTIFNISYPDFLPFPVHDFEFESDEYPTPEEGLPGESGSAVARDQSSQRFNVHLTESDIEEGAGPPRVDGQNVFVHEHSRIGGDPVRDSNIHHKPSVPHLINRPRTLLSLSNRNSTTGFESEYLILKPGVLRVGSSYLIQVSATNEGNNLDGFAMEFVKVNSGPINGRCTLMPTKGYSISFNFQLHCLEWKSAHWPLYYELRYSLVQDNPGHLIYYGLNRNAKFVLPAGIPTNSYNVYLNVVIRDSLQASTKVCSLIRKVEPLSANITFIPYIYNETFHPRSSLMKFLEAKQNQATLHKIHVLSSSLYHHSFLNITAKSHEDRDLIHKIRLRFLEIIDNMKILGKVEAIQALSTLSEIISNIDMVTMFDLQKAFNIYQKIYQKRSELLGDFSLEALEYEYLVFLSKLAFASHSVDFRNEELIEIARELFSEEIKQKMATHHKTEEPILIDVPHVVTTALCISNLQNNSSLLLKLKHSYIEVTSLISVEKRNENCLLKSYTGFEDCIPLIVQEFDYTAMPHNLNFIPASVGKVASVLLSLPVCLTSNGVEIENSLHFIIKFFRKSKAEVLEKSIVNKDLVNMYMINITEGDLHHSLLFHVKVLNANINDFKYSAEVFFKYKYYPTSHSYDWKSTLPVGSVDNNYFIPRNYIIAPGTYYFSVHPLDFDGSISSNESSVYLDVKVWKQICISKSHGYWSSENCQSLNSSNHNWINCKCSSPEIAAISVPVKTNLLLIPTNQLLHSFFNVTPVLIFTAIFAVYIVLLLLNNRKDKCRNFSNSAIPVIDNSDDHKQFYLVCLKTGMYFSSGTTASVFIVLHGMKGVTETRQLIGYNPKNYSFQKGSTDLFLISSDENLGPLVKVEVMHNNYGPSPSWFLKNILVKDVKTGCHYAFNCFKWLAADRDDSLIERELLLTDNPSSFNSVLWDYLITFIHDYNMWNSIMCESPATFYTGVQRLTCCLCFLLNSAFILTALQDQILEMASNDSYLLHLSPKLLIICLLISSMATIPQLLLTALFRHSVPPAVELNPQFNRIFCSLSLQHLYCWLQQKRSNSSRSSGSSVANTDGSDSLYSSFEESSIISTSNILEDSFSSDEKQDFSDSFSTPDLNDPVSPLQKSISTWQAFENWVKRKHTLIVNVEIPGRQQLYVEKSDSAMAPEDILLEELNHFDNTDDDIVDSYSNPPEENPVSDNISQDLHPENVNAEITRTSRRLQLLFLHPLFYYIAWILVITNSCVCLISVLINTTSYDFIKCAVLLKYMFISGLLSCFVWTPVVILLVSLMVMLKTYSEQDIPQSNNDVIAKLSKCELQSKDYQSSYKRMEYFKKYLRPPKEEVLEKFRQCNIREKIICTMQCLTVKYISMLLLLLILLLPLDKQIRFLQKSAIHNSLFKNADSSNWNKSLNSKLAIAKWLKSDFIDVIHNKQYCSEQDLQCDVGYIAGSFLIGNVAIRLFKVPNSGTTFVENWNCPDNNNNYLILQDLQKEYERRKLVGYHRAYCEEDHLIILDKSYMQASYQLEEILPILSNITCGALSVEFILFNPSFSMLLSVSILFEYTEKIILLSKNIIIGKLFEMHSAIYYIKFTMNLIFLLITLLNCKNQCWQFFKQGLFYFKNTKSYFNAIFNFLSMCYLVSYITYVTCYKAVLFKLRQTNFNSNIDFTEMVMYENIHQTLLSFLIFVHLIGLLNLITYSSKLKILLKRLTNVWKIIFAAFIVFLLSLYLYEFMRRIFSGMNKRYHHPLFIYQKGLPSFFSDYKKPEIDSDIDVVDKYVSIIVMFAFVATYVYLFAFIRTVLIQNKCVNQIGDTKSFCIKDTTDVINKKLKQFFPSGKPLVVSKENFVLPTEFLLLELEELTETLLKKADMLFPEEDNECIPDLNDATVNGSNYTKAKFQVIEEDSKLELEGEKESLSGMLQNNDLISPKLEAEVVAEVMKRLNATMPRQSKPKGKHLLPTSLNASLASQRKFKHRDTNISLSASLQCHKIRKTYPLCHLDSDTSSETANSSEKDKIPDLTLRKTKSKGKGKTCEFDLNISEDHAL